MQDLIFKALKAARDGKTDKELMVMAGAIEHVIKNPPTTRSGECKVRVIDVDEEELAKMIQDKIDRFIHRDTPLLLHYV
jgi:hypothetical protein